MNLESRIQKTLALAEAFMSRYSFLAHAYLFMFHRLWTIHISFSLQLAYLTNSSSSFTYPLYSANKTTQERHIIWSNILKWAIFPTFILKSSVLRIRKNLRAQELDSFLSCGKKYWCIQLFLDIDPHGWSFTTIRTSQTTPQKFIFCHIAQGRDHLIIGQLLFLMEVSHNFIFIYF